MKITQIFISISLIFTTLVCAQETFTVGSTEYYYNQTYSTTGKQMVKRSESNKKEFLRDKGYDKTPYGYEIDHIVPLSQGGSDDPSNMQLLTVDQHKAKTARERASTSSYSTYSTPVYSNFSTTVTAPSYYSSSTPVNDNKTYYTGSKGGKYYYNSNGNKTYVKKSTTSTYTAPSYKVSSYSSSPSYNSNSSRTLQTGSRGGTYYINSNGNKTYVKKN